MTLAMLPGQGLQEAVKRRFLAILGGSLLLHAALLALVAIPHQASQAPLRFLASIRLIDPTESGPVAAAPHPAPASVPQKARQNPSRAASPSASHVTQTAGPANAPAHTPLPPVGATGETAPSRNAAVADASPAVPPVGAPRPQNELLDGYRQRLGDLLAGRQEYPRVAALRGWEGEVRLRLKVARKGNLLDVRLERSSGFDVLDQHALAILERLASLPPLPDGLDGSEIQVVVPVNYKLKKTT